MVPILHLDTFHETTDHHQGGFCGSFQPEDPGLDRAMVVAGVAEVSYANMESKWDIETTTRLPWNIVLIKRPIAHFDPLGHANEIWPANLHIWLGHDVGLDLNTYDYSIFPIQSPQQWYPHHIIPHTAVLPVGSGAASAPCSSFNYQ